MKDYKKSISFLAIIISLCRTRGEQWMLIWSPNPTNGGCTIVSDRDNSWLIETIFLLLAVTILLEVAKYAKRH